MLDRDKKGRFIKGMISWSKLNKGKYKQNISDPIGRGEKISEGKKSKNLKYSKEIRQKISNALIGRKLSKEHKEKIGKANLKEKCHFWKGGRPHCKKCNKELKNYKAKFCNSHKGMNLEKNPSWHGGTSFEPYSIDWTDTLRRSIRERDKYICQICRKEPSVYVHHIDYDKKNCNPKNLITLCRNCHSKTNHNRTEWKRYFNTL